MDYPAYNPTLPVLPLNAAELDGLDRLLQALPVDGAMTLDGMDGYLTALLVGPPTLLADLPTGAWLPAVWGGDAHAGGEGERGDHGTAADIAPDKPAGAAPFASNKQRKTTVVMVLRHLRHLDVQLQQASTAADTTGAAHARPTATAIDQASDWEPIFSVAEQGAQEWVDARDWCAGFLQAVDLLPSAWDSLLDDAALGVALRPLLILGGGLDSGLDGGLDSDSRAQDAQGEADLDDLRVCDALSRAVPDAVLQVLARRSRPAALDQSRH